VCKPGEGPKGPWQSVRDRQQKSTDTSKIIASSTNSSNQIKITRKNSKLKRNQTKSNLHELSNYAAKNTDLEEDLFTG